MRNILMAASISLVVAGCGHHGIPGGNDLATNEDMSVGDDLSIADMTIPEDAKTLVSFTQFAMDYANAWCTHLMNCQRLDNAQFALCVENNTILRGWDEDTEIMKGRVQVNELQCLDAIKTARCDDSDSGYVTARCLSFFDVPHQANGDVCVADDECMSAFCQHNHTDAGGSAVQPAGCPGTCQPPKAPTSPCFGADSTECGPNGFCDAPDDNTAGTCQLFADVNQDCSTVSCKNGLMCPVFGATPTCQMPATQTALGGACDPYQGAYTDMPSCAPGMYCQLQYDAGMNAIGGKCATLLAKDAACNLNDVGSYFFVDNDCIDGTVCTPTADGTTAGTCKTYGAANAQCWLYGSDPLVSTCKAGLYCQANAAGSHVGTCKPLLSDGSLCSDTRLCASIVAGQSVCIVDNPDAGAIATCNRGKSFGATCIPGFEDSLCAGSSGANTTYCAPTGSSGTCAPKCF